MERLKDTRPMDDDHLFRKFDAINDAVEKAIAANEKFLRENPRPFADIIAAAISCIECTKKKYRIADEMMPEISAPPDGEEWGNVFAHIEDAFESPDGDDIDEYAELFVFLRAVHKGAKKLDEINGVKK